MATTKERLQKLINDCINDFYNIYSNDPSIIRPDMVEAAANEYGYLHPDYFPPNGDHPDGFPLIKITDMDWGDADNGRLHALYDVVYQVVEEMRRRDMIRPPPESVLPEPMITPPPERVLPEPGSDAEKAQERLGLWPPLYGLDSQGRPKPITAKKIPMMSAPEFPTPSELFRRRFRSRYYRKLYKDPAMRKRSTESNVSPKSTPLLFDNENGRTKDPPAYNTRAKTKRRLQRKSNILAQEAKRIEQMQAEATGNVQGDSQEQNSTNPAVTSESNNTIMADVESGHAQTAQEDTTHEGITQVDTAQEDTAQEDTAQEDT